MFVIESTIPGTPMPNHENWGNILVANDYIFVIFDSLIDIMLLKNNTINYCLNSIV